MVFLISLNQVNALEYVGNVVYSPLWNIENFHGVVQIKALLLSLHQKLNELLRQLNQPVFLPTFLAREGVLKAWIVMSFLLGSVSSKILVSFIWSMIFPMNLAMMDRCFKSCDTLLNCGRWVTNSYIVARCLLDSLASGWLHHACFLRLSLVTRSSLSLTSRRYLRLLYDLLFYQRILCVNVLVVTGILRILK